MIIQFFCSESITTYINFNSQEYTINHTMKLDAFP